MPEIAETESAATLEEVAARLADEPHTARFTAAVKGGAEVDTG